MFCKRIQYIETFYNQGMEQPQVEIIDTVCQNLQLIASLIQNYVS